MVYGVAKSQTRLSDFHFTSPYSTSDLLLSHVTSSRFIHVSTNDPLLFLLWLSNILIYIEQLSL